VVSNDKSFVITAFSYGYAIQMRLGMRLGRKGGEQETIQAGPEKPGI